MTTRQMETRLMRYFDYTKNLIVPTVTANGLLMFEADLLVLTPAGYATVVETKVSKSDLKNDLQKKHIKVVDKPFITQYGKLVDIEYYYKNLKYFYYAVPKKLEKCALEQIPEFCGLLIVDIETVPATTEYTSEQKIQICRQVREPKILFKKAWSKEEQFNIARLGTMRLHGLMMK